MFDISFGELVMIGAVALVVIGPEKLPKVAKTAGILFGRMQRFVNSVKSDLAAEMHASELKALEAELRSEAAGISGEFQNIVADVRTATRPEENHIMPTNQTAPVQPAPEPPPATVPAQPDDGQLDLFAAPPPVSSALRDRR